jgi:hypothetical protein
MKMKPFLAVAAAIGLWAQSGAPALKDRIAELKESMAANKAKLRNYGWTETTQVLLKGEVKKTEQYSCSYGPDGQVVKMPMSPPAPEKSHRGLKGKIAEEKKEEMTDYMKNVKALLGQYAPPDPTRLQAAFQAGKAELIPTGGSAVTLKFHDYLKPGDEVTIAYDRTTKAVTSYTVKTYGDDQKDAVSLTAAFASLPDGTNYMQQSVLDAPEKKIQVKTTNASYHPLRG